MTPGGQTPAAADVYYDFLWVSFAAAYPAFVNTAAERSAASPAAWRSGLGLVLLRLLAMTRNSLTTPDALLALLDGSDAFKLLISELGGTPPTPQLMLYYGPDLLRMGLGSHLIADIDGAGLKAGLEGLLSVLALARTAVNSQRAVAAYELNVADAVAAIKAAGPAWGGGTALQALLASARVEQGLSPSEGRLRLV